MKLLLLSIIFIYKYNSQITECSEQLFNFYVAKGLLPNTTIIPVINLTAGILGGTTFVDADYLFQEVAREYQSTIDGNIFNSSNLYINSFSVDVPWCVTQLDIQCASQVVGCCIAKPNCDLNDFDEGGTNPVAGRMFVYPDQSPPCNGRVSIRWWNTILIPFSILGPYGEYTYDNYGMNNLIVPTFSPTTVPTDFPTIAPTTFPTKSPTSSPTNQPTKGPTQAPTGVPTIVPSAPTGIPTLFPTKFPTLSPTPFPTKSPTSMPTLSPTEIPTSAPTPLLTTALTYDESENLYRFSTCTFSDGDPIFSLTQPIYRCVYEQIGCNGSRMAGIPSKKNTPIAAYACRSDATNITTESMIWQIFASTKQGEPDGYFGLSFFITFIPPNSPPQYFLQISVAGTRRQYKSNFGGFNQIANMFYPPFNMTTKQIQFTPNYIYSEDPIIRDIPCICGFSVDCANNSFLLEDFIISSNYNVSNRIPLCKTDPPLLILIGSSTNITLNGSLSSDSDGPLPISYYWKLYSKPIGSPNNVFIPNVTSISNIINVSDFSAGLYSFLLYVSDGMNIPVFCFANFTFELNVVTAVTAIDFTIGIIPCAGGQSTFIPLNGTLSWETNTNFTLYYSWVQFLGWNVLPNTFDSGCGNYTKGLFFANESFAYFVTDKIGLYAFNLTVTDGITNPSSDTIFIRVVPLSAQNVSQPVPYPNFTLPPIRNFSQPPRPIINFTGVPTSIQPTPPTIPTPPNPPTNAPTPNASNTTNTTVPPIIPDFPIPSKTDQFIITFFWFVMLLLLVLFVGLWITEYPSEKINFYERKRYYT